MDRDFEYICRSVGALSGIPVRLYKNGEEQMFYSMVKLPVDPMVAYKKEILAIDDEVGYFATSNLNYYGVFTSGCRKIIIGPTRLVPNSLQELHDMAFLADVPQENITEFIAGMKAIVGLPLERLMQMLCLLTYLVNGRKMNIEQVEIYEEQQENFQRNIVQQSSSITESGQLYRKVSNTFSAEKTMLDIVAKGDVTYLNEWLAKPPAVQSSILADDLLRHLKNTFISTVTLASRSAISGGMDPSDAIKMADGYIYKAELTNNADSIINLQYHAVKTFTEKVNALKFGEKQSRLVTEVANYIQHNLSKAITAQDIADAMFISRPYLSKKFREEAGITLTDFIRNQKIEEAKRLLKYTDKSLLAISVYLGFSSQSHFTHTFKKLTGVIPKEYRENK